MAIRSARGDNALNLPPMPEPLSRAVGAALGKGLLTAEANPALVWTRYLKVWEDFGTGRQEDVGKELQEFSGAYNALGKERAPKERLRLHHARMKGLAAAAFEATLLSPFVLGLGADHATENGFSFDPMVGVPLVPGSALKGLCRATAEMLGEPLEKIVRVLGSAPPAYGMSAEGTVPGSVIFHGAWPVWWPSLRVEIMTPHNVEWMQKQMKSERVLGKGEALPVPSLFEEPRPVSFLAVEPRSGQQSLRYRFYLSARDGDSALTEQAWAWLALGLDLLGVGGKTAAGYGRMRRSDAQETVLPPPPEAEERASLLLVYTHPIQGRPVVLQPRQVARELGVRLTGDPLVDQQAHDVWENACEAVRRLVARLESRLRAQASAAPRVDIVALAPQPHLIALGRALGEGIEATVHLKRRDQPWGWGEHSPPGEARPALTSPAVDRGRPALLVSLSGTIWPQTLPDPGDAGDWRTWTVSVDDPGIDRITTETQRRAFVAAVRRAFQEMRDAGATEVDIFPAMPAALAVELGRASSLGASPALRVWDRSAKGWVGPYVVA